MINFAAFWSGLPRKNFVRNEGIFVFFTLNLGLNFSYKKFTLPNFV